MTLTPAIVTPSEVRLFINPYLDHDDFDDSILLQRILAYEEYVKQTYFDGSLPTTAKYPLIMLISADVISDPSVRNSPDHGDIKKIMDITFQSRTGDVLDTANEWKTQAKAWLRRLAYEKTYHVEIVNG